jgi:hypothetical protein
MMSRRRSLLQVSLFLLAMVIRLTLFLIASSDEERFIRPDTMKYVRPANNLVDYGTFSSSTEEPLEREFDITPGFPAFIITVFSIFGRSFTMLALILLLIDSTVPVILFRIGDLWRYWKVGAVAGLLYAVNLLCVISCQHILTDSLFTFFLSLQILFYIRFFRGGKSRDLILTVFVLGIMTLIRPVASNWIFILLGMLLFTRPLPGNRRVLRIFVTAVVFAAICAPWITRNVRGGAGVRLTTNNAKAVRYNFATAVEAVVTGKPAGMIRTEWRESDNILFSSDPELFPDENSRYNHRMDKGLETIRRHPLVFAKLSARPYVFLPALDAFYEHIGVSAGGKGTLDILTRQGPWEAVGHYFDGRTWLLVPVLPWILILGVTYLASGIGLFICFREKAWGALLAFVFFALYYIALLGPLTLSRYRLPAMPAIVLMAGLGMTSWKKLQKKNEPPGTRTQYPLLKRQVL